MRTRSLNKNRGFTLVEALVALLVTAFGMLAIAGLHINLTLSADVARQRAEATRLAQQRMEQLRAFQQIAVQAGVATYEGMVSTVDTPATTSNATFTRTSNVSAADASNDTLRTITVQVAWNDRTGQAQAVNLASVISKSDPADIGGLAVPPIDNGIMRRPKGRDLNIPIPSTKLDGSNKGKSTLQWGGQSGGWLVFSDTSGDVIAKCNSQPTNNTDISTCTTIEAYLLTGFVNGDWLTSFTQMTLSNLANVTGTPECYVAAATDQNTGQTIAGYKSYACLIQPTDHDNNPNTYKVWSGKAVLWLLQSGTQIAPSGSNKVCRYTSNQTNLTGMYELIDESLDNQNYALISSGNCPSGSTQHQP